MQLEKTLQKLVSFKTVTDNIEENKKALVWFKDEACKAVSSLYVQHFEIQDHPALILTTKKTKTPKVWLLAHMDVVPAPEELFTLKREKTKALGRGVYDMKGAIACYLELLRNFGEEASKYDFGVMLTADEEKGGNGAEGLVKQGYVSDVCVDPDGGEHWQLETKAKGIWYIKIQSQGKASHGSRPWDGDNAIDKLFSFVERIREKVDLKGASDLFTPTMNLATIKGGGVMNMVPEYAEATLDIRYTDKENLEKFKDVFQSTAKDFPGITLETVDIYNSYNTSMQDEYMRAFTDAMPKEHKKNQEGTFSHGSSDAVYFSEKGIPTILTRPEGRGLHADDEWIDMEDLEVFCNTLEKFVTSVSGT